MLRSIMMMVCLASLAGCPSDGGVSPKQACEDTASAQCERIYACLTPEEITSAGLPASEAACVTMLQASRGCEAQTTKNACTGNAKYQPSEASKCSDQVAGLACSQVRDPFFDLATEAPACASICKI